MLIIGPHQRPLGYFPSLSNSLHSTPEKKGRLCIGANRRQQNDKYPRLSRLPHVRAPLVAIVVCLRIGATLALRWGRITFPRSILIAAESCYVGNFHTSKTLTNGNDAPMAEPAIDAWHQHMNRSQDAAVNGKPVVQQLLEKPTWRRTVGPSCVLEQAGHSKITDQTEQARDEDERLCCRQFRTDETGPRLNVSTYITNCATRLKTKAAAPSFRGRPLSFRRRKFLLLWRRLRCHLRRHLR